MHGVMGPNPRNFSPSTKPQLSGLRPRPLTFRAGCAAALLRLSGGFTPVETAACGFARAGAAWLARGLADRPAVDRVGDFGGLTCWATILPEPRFAANLPFSLPPPAATR